MNIIYPILLWPLFFSSIFYQHYPNFICIALKERDYWKGVNIKFLLGCFYFFFHRIFFLEYNLKWDLLFQTVFFFTSIILSIDINFFFVWIKMKKKTINQNRKAQMPLFNFKNYNGSNLWQINVVSLMNVIINEIMLSTRKYYFIIQIVN